MPAVLLAGLIAAESGFEDRQGSGNITDIQHVAERERGALTPAKGEIPDWFAPEEGSAPALVNETRIAGSPPSPGPAISEVVLPDPSETLGSSGARLPLPEPDLIERAPPAA